MLHKDKNILNAATQLLEFTKNEILSIMTCPECYKLASDHPNGSFSMTCKTLHPVVWAKSDGYCYWPAKAMKFEENLVHVRYFGEHEMDFLPLKNCRNFSRKSPKPVAKSDQLYVASMEVCVLK